MRTNNPHREAPWVTITASSQLARDVLVERGICSFTTTTPNGVTRWHAHPSTEIIPAGVQVVAANLDKREALDPVQFGDSRDLHLAAAHAATGASPPLWQPCWRRRIAAVREAVAT